MSTNYTSMQNGTFQGLSLSEKFEYVYCVFGGFGPWSGIIMYLFVTAGTIEYFNGEVSDTAKFWCIAVASADATLSFVFLNALWHFHTKKDYRVLAIRTMVVYSIFHFGAFQYGDWKFGHPINMKLIYIPSIILSFVALGFWGEVRT